MQVLEELEGDAETHEVHWTKLWQCVSEAQSMKTNPWTNEEPRRLEEGLPRLREENLEKAARSFKTLRVWAVSGSARGFWQTCQKKRWEKW